MKTKHIIKIDPVLLQTACQFMKIFTETVLQMFLLVSNMHVANVRSSTTLVTDCMQNFRILAQAIVDSLDCLLIMFPMILMTEKLKVA